METKDDQREAALAAIHLAINAANSKAPSDKSFGAFLALADRASHQQVWQISAARKLVLGWKDWLAKPWHCWMLRKLLNRLLTESLPPKREAADVQLLTRCAALIEFGVDVNSVWYQRLRLAVIDGRITRTELRSLLKSSTVWWGTHEDPQSVTPIWKKPVLNLWRMGRPSIGDLIVIRHGWVVKALLLTMLIASSTLISQIGMAAQQNWVKHGAAFNYSLLALVAFQLATVIWFTWFIGPRSWIAAKRMLELFPELDRDAYNQPIPA